MHVGMILEMASDSLADRVALDGREQMTYAQLAQRARRVGTYLAKHACENVVLVDLNSPAVPIALFGAAIAGKPFAPVNYRLANDRLQAIIKRTTPCLVIGGVGVSERIGDIDGVDYIDRDVLLAIGNDESIPET